MSFCGQCGFNNSDDARFCAKCGAELNQQRSSGSGSGRQGRGSDSGRKRSGFSIHNLIYYLLVIGLVGYIGYTFYQKHISDGDSYEPPVSTSYKGTPLSQIAEENEFPVVSYDMQPNELAYYMNADKSLTLRFSPSHFKDDAECNMIMAVMYYDKSGEGKTRWCRIAPIGGSMHRVDCPADKSYNGYIFVYRDRERILLKDKNGLQEFNYPSDDDD